MSKKKSAKAFPAIAPQKSVDQVPQEIDEPPIDKLVLKIYSLRTSDIYPKHYAIKVTFFDQLLVHAIIKSIGTIDKESTDAIANGTMNYDPSDYEKMCLYADTPLVVHIQPLRHISESKSGFLNMELMSPETTKNISCCNVDILSIFLGVEDKQKLYIKKHMEPMVQPATMYCKSWESLPLVTMELTAERDPANAKHHKVLEKANWMKLTLIASYNMFIPYESDFLYTAASKTPLYNENKVDLVTFSQGYAEPRRFDYKNFYPKWETLRLSGETFTNYDEKLQYKLEDIQNEDGIDLSYYMERILPYHTCVWGSFHRTLLLNGDKWLWKHIRNYNWPLEIHIYGEKGGYSFMAFLNLFQLLYPGERTIRLVVPLQWANSAFMMKACGCDLLLTPNDKPPSERSPSPPPPMPTTKGPTESLLTSMTTLTASPYRPTGSDDNDAFVLVEVKLRRPLKEALMPPRYLHDDLSEMLKQMEKEAPKKRICTGRGQLERDWQKTVRCAANSLRKVPYYGALELCSFNRQLGETRTRVELITSCWQDAAIYVNNHFVVEQYLHSDKVYEELVMMAHACLMRSASAILLTDQWLDVEPAIRSARHARQIQDRYHAMELYLQLVVEEPRNSDYWRELSTCMKDIDRDWARVCLDKAVLYNPRHPLTLISKGAMLFEDDPIAAEPFFIALLAWNPLWSTVWTIASVYFYERQLFHVADVIMKHAEMCRSKHRQEEMKFARSWQHELGDWWDSTPLLPGMCLYYDAADLLVRLRAVALAEVCMARVLSTSGETAPYYHLVGLCCRLRGSYKDALCHLHVGLRKFGEVCYLRSLEAEIQHKLGKIGKATKSYAKAGSCMSSFSILMSLECNDEHARSTLLDLTRRQPSAYAWAALADDWLKPNTCQGEGDEPKKKTSYQNDPRTCAIVCAVQALKIDPRAGKAYAILGKLVRPSARRLHCLQMANLCGWTVTEEEMHVASLPSETSLCHNVGTALRECRCNLCDKTQV